MATVVVGGFVFALGDWDATAPVGPGGYLGRAASQAADGAGISAPGIPIWLTAVLQVPLWLGLLGVPLWAARVKGKGLKADFGWQQESADIPLGLMVGVLTQFVLVPLVYLPLLWLIDLDEVDDAARQLTDRVSGSLDVVLLVLIVGIGAPIVEEIFYRGLLFRSLDRRAGRIVAIAASSVLFGVSHLQGLQLPALIMFGLVAAALVHIYDRLGPAIWAHIGFNMTTVIVLLT